MKMKKCFAFLLALLLVCGALPTLAEGDLLSRIQEKGEIVIATEGAWAPWTYHDESDALVGFDVEIGRRIAEKLGVKATFVEVAWDGIFAGMDAKMYDIAINGVDVTPDRSEKYDFSTPYAFIRTALVVRADNESIRSFEDLKGKRTANSIGSTYMTLAEDYGATVLGVDTLEQTMNMIVAGRADATLNAEVSVYDYLNMIPDANVKIVALTEEANLVSIPVRKGEENASFLAALSEAIDALRAEGVLSELSVKYFGSDITNAK